jgi:hypothetical protein
VVALYLSFCTCLLDEIYFIFSAIHVDTVCSAIYLKALEKFIGAERIDMTAQVLA